MELRDRPPACDGSGSGIGMNQCLLLPDSNRGDASQSCKVAEHVEIDFDEAGRIYKDESLSLREKRNTGVESEGVRG